MLCVLAGCSRTPSTGPVSLQAATGAALPTARPAEPAPHSIQQSAATEAHTEVADQNAVLPANTADTEASSRDLANAYLNAWSSPDDPSGEAIRRFYAQTVNFYGRGISRDELMRQKHVFAHRWPTRSYVARPDDMSVQCEPVGGCHVSGVLDWRASDQASGRKSIGAARFEMGIHGGLIVSEFGSVISRGDAAP
jgi:hypothetical protein